MSYRVNGTGREYHNYQEYQSALRRAEEERRRAEEERIRREVKRLDNKRLNLKSQFDSAAGDSKRLQGIARQLHQNYEDFEQFHNRLRIKQREFEARMDAQFNEDWKHMERQTEVATQRVNQKTKEMEKATGALRSQVEKEVLEAQNGLESLEQQRVALKEEINRHKRETNEQFKKLESELDTRLEDFNQLLIEVNQAVTKERQALDDKITEDFNQELVQLGDDSKRADAVVEKVIKDLESIRSQIAPYGLESHSKAVEEKIKMIHEDTNPSNRLILAQETYVEGRTMAKVQEDREMQMSSSWQDDLQEIEELCQMIPEQEVAEELKNLKKDKKEFQKLRREGNLDRNLIIFMYYQEEFSQAQKELDNIKKEIQAEQSNPQWFNFEGRTVERRQRIFELRDTLTGYHDAAPAQEEKHRELRLPAIQKIRERMKRIMGAKPTFNAVIEPEQGADEKKAKVLHMEWGKVKYDAYVDINGQIIDESQYGFDTNEQCARAGNVVQEQIIEQPRVLSPDVTHENPPTSEPEVIQEVENMKKQARRPK